MTDRTALYRLYDAGDQLLYVGVTKDPKERFKQHRGDKPWWLAVAMKDVEWFPTSGAALGAERAVIADERPRYNTRSVPIASGFNLKECEPLPIVAFKYDIHSVMKAVTEEGRKFAITRHGKPVAVLQAFPVEQEEAT